MTDPNRSISLAQLSALLSDETNLQQTLVTCLAILLEHSGFKCAQLFVLSESKTELVPVLFQSELGSAISLSDKSNRITQSFSSQKTVVLSGEDTFLESSAILCPLVRSGGGAGVLVVWRGPESIDNDEIGLVRSIASILHTQLSVEEAEKANFTLRRTVFLNFISEQCLLQSHSTSSVLQMLMRSLIGYFHLDCGTAVAFNSNSEVELRLCIGHDSADDDDASILQRIGDKLVLNYSAGLSEGRVISLNIADTMGSESNAIKMVLLVPVHDGTTLRAALCLMSSSMIEVPSAEDLNVLTVSARCVARVLNQLHLMQELIRFRVDAVTGLFTPGYVHGVLAGVIDHCKESNQPVSCLFVQVDRLTEIADQHGIDCCNLLIQSVSKLLAEQLEPVAGNLLASYGNGRFIAILPGAYSSDAADKAEGICARVSVLSPPNGLPVSCSIGVSTFPDDAAGGVVDGDSLIWLARQASLAVCDGGTRVCGAHEIRVERQPQQPGVDDKPVGENEQPEDASTVQDCAQGSLETPSPEQGSLTPVDIGVVAEHGLLGLLGGVIKFIENIDGSQSDRSPRAVKYASLVCSVLRLPEELSQTISLSVMLSLLGKLAVSAEILSKKEPLTEAEREQLKVIPTAAARMLSQGKGIFEASPLVESIRENWDGTGYPKGLKGEEIPLPARIVSLVDSYIAMTSPRPYRNALTKEEAVVELENGAGRQWDPRLVKLMIAILTREDEELDFTPEAVV